VIAGVDVIDEHTVVVRTNEPYPLLPARLSEWFVLSKAHVEATDPATLVIRPVGTGAYTFVEWVKDELLVLRANAVDGGWRYRSRPARHASRTPGTGPAAAGRSRAPAACAPRLRLWRRAAP
jgi:ABC-type transport system substrate-binding protein